MSWGADRTSSEPLRIHGEKWSEILVNINHDGFMTQLGVIWNMDLNNDKQFEALKESIEDIGARICRYQGRTGDKVLALEYCLRSGLAYRMQFCVWGYERYEELDKVYMRLVRKITRNMKGYPAKPIWALAVDGGLGIQSLQDFVHKCKLRILLRNINKGDKTGEAFEGLVARALRSSGQGGLRDRKVSILSNLAKPTWMTSLVTWLAKMGLVITVQGGEAEAWQSELIQDDLPQRAARHERGVVLKGEDSHEDSHLQIEARVGQCWELEGKVLEITGFLGDW